MTEKMDDGDDEDVDEDDVFVLVAFDLGVPVADGADAAAAVGVAESVADDADLLKTLARDNDSGMLRLGLGSPSLPCNNVNQMSQ